MNLSSKTQNPSDMDCTHKSNRAAVVDGGTQDVSPLPAIGHRLTAIESSPRDPRQNPLRSAVFPALFAFFAARSNSRLSSYLLLLALFALALMPRLYRLDAQSLWLDEGSSWQMINQDWSVLLHDLLSPTAAYPLYHTLLKLWTALMGDAEWMLRFPSALAGAAATAAIFFAAAELTGKRDIRFPLAAALLQVGAPFALWYAQEAKVYSLLLLMSTLLIWSLARAFRHPTRGAWLLFGVLALLSLFVHRLAILLLIAAGSAWLLVAPPRSPVWRSVGWGALGLLGAGLVFAMQQGLGSERAATGAYIPADPLLALGLTFSRFSIDRWPGDAPWWWLAPWAGLATWGLAHLFVDAHPRRTEDDAAHKQRRTARIVLSFLFAPLVLFLAQLAFTQIYEARYLMLIFPAWTLALAYPAANGANGKQPVPAASEGIRATYAILWATAIGVGIAALFQPGLGLFSGDPVKEQYREAIGELARRVHPDDAVVVHPGYIRPLYAYYMHRLSADPAPEPITFADFWQGETAYGQREWDVERRTKLAGYARSFLLIAPDHARTVDAPAPGDEYGLVGLFWAYSGNQRAWPCGIWRFNGVHTLCQEAPERYTTGAIIEPETRLTATFGANVQLLGYTLKATTFAGPGVYRVGGALPISLFWDVHQSPDEDYSIFLHLCQDCSIPPVASDDGPPLAGYLPTSTWLPGKPARDDRTIPLPSDLPPGRYTLLLGMYRPGDPSPAARLSTSGAEEIDRTPDDNRLTLGEIEIVRSDAW